MDKKQARVEATPKVSIDNNQDFSYNSSDTVSIRSRLDAVVKVTGAVTGNTYIWARAGAVVDVDELDQNEILNKTRGRACCGGQSGKALFELA